MYQEIGTTLAAQGRPERVAGMAKFFQAYPGGYGEGDQFLAVTVPAQRAVAGQYWRAATPADCAQLLDSPYHEHRLTAVFVLERMFAAAERARPVRGAAVHAAADEVFALLAGRIDRLNNWDLVDSAAPKITGPYLLRRDRTPLREWADSGMLWRERMAVMSTFAFIRAGEFEPTLQLCAQFLHHPHDLIHKATGWMLREIAKRDMAPALAFLDRHHRQMPRTMLRYAIERFDIPTRSRYLARDEHST